MSYFYSLDHSITITKDFKRFCYDHDLSVSHRGEPRNRNAVIDLLDDKYGVSAEFTYRNGHVGVEIAGGPTVSERLGLQGVKEALKGLLEYADDPEYLAVDENSNELLLTK